MTDRMKHPSSARKSAAKTESCIGYTSDMKRREISEPHRFITSLAILCGASILLLVVRVMSSESARYVFMLWNLVLAIIPVLLSWWLVLRVRHEGWLVWQQILLVILWIAFLPNSFYLVTDFVHLRQTYEATLLFDVVLLTSFTASGLILGFTSVYMVHREVVKKLSETKSYLVIGFVFLACSFAIYLGRFTRWNTWDLVYEPAGVLFDVSDRFVNPGAHTETYTATLLLFVLLTSIYGVVYEGARLAKRS